MMPKTSYYDLSFNFEEENMMFGDLDLAGKLNYADLRLQHFPSLTSPYGIIIIFITSILIKLNLKAKCRNIRERSKN